MVSGNSSKLFPITNINDETLISVFSLLKKLMKEKLNVNQNNFLPPMRTDYLACQKSSSTVQRDMLHHNTMKC